MLSRELFWGIHHGWLTYLVALLMIAVLGCFCRLKVSRWRRGREETLSFQWQGQFQTLFRYLISQRFQSDNKATGLLHLFIFYGFLILFLGTVLLMFDSHLDLHFLAGEAFVAYKLLLNFFGLLALSGITGLILRRYVFKQAAGGSKTQTLFALVLSFFVLLTGFVVEGSRMSVTAGDNPGWRHWAFPVYPVVVLLHPLGPATISTVHTVTWWVHMLLAFIMMTALGWTKLSHILTVPLNLFYQARQQPGRLRETNMAGKDFGAARLKDFTKTQLISVDACVSAGRCEINCPAFKSAKPLSPRVLMEKLQSSDDETPLVGEIISVEALWACTTCGACQKKCPVLANPVEKIIDLRRHQVLALGSFPQSMQNAMVSTLKRGHPWSGAGQSRLDWAKGLGVPLADQKKHFDVLFWVGCTGALVERNIKVTRAIVKLLLYCHIDFAVLGLEESCTCHMARRAGNEYIYQITAKKNILKLKQYTYNTIVTACPHCYHTLKNEYNLAKEGLQVISHVQYFQGLANKGKLEFSPEGLKKTITYHDPCYYGRINGIFDSPREVCALAGVQLAEAANSRENTFCCGGGGGGIWMDDQNGQRMNEVRAKQLLKNQIELIVTACPFCIQMLESALSSLGCGKDIEVRDIAELMALQLKKEFA